MNSVAGCVIGMIVALAAAGAARADACADLAAARFADVRIVSAETTTPNPAASQDFCRVQGIIGKEVGFELWLPTAPAWNGKFLVGGVGGQAGQVNKPVLARGVGRGYATASTDAGHKVADTHWLLGGPERAANYAYLANHRLAEVGKTITAAFYSRPPRRSYFLGCSGGGRQALTEVQRYPLDFDGVIAGAPGPKTPEMSARRLWEMGQHSANAGLMSDAQWRFVAQAAIKRCDSDDGLADGVIDNPWACRFDAASLQCPATRAAGAQCLTPQQIALVKRIYAPLHDETGRTIDDGLLPGVRVQAAPLPEPYTPGPAYLAVVLFGDGVHHDAHWDTRQFRIARDLPAVDAVMDLHADRPDLSAFKARGGKLILFQGLADPLVAAQQTTDYYRAVARRMGGMTATQAFARLFLIPGMEHCLGGDSTDVFGQLGADGTQLDPEHDLLSALDAWVEQGRAPTRLIASKVDGGAVVRERPLCVFPEHATYDGHGDAKSAAAFVCRPGPSRP
jgi:feruloyl esterase